MKKDQGRSQGIPVCPQSPRGGHAALLEHWVILQVLCPVPYCYDCKQISQVKRNQEAISKANDFSPMQYYIFCVFNNYIRLINNHWSKQWLKAKNCGFPQGCWHGLLSVIYEPKRFFQCCPFHFSIWLSGTIRNPQLLTQNQLDLLSDTEHL